MSKFTDIQDAAIGKAAAVPGSVDDFLVGLEEMLEILQERVNIERSLRK